jgi:hypothetical protein
MDGRHGDEGDSRQDGGGRDGRRRRKKVGVQGGSEWEVIIFLASICVLTLHT